MQRSRSTGASPSTASSAQIERLGRSWAAAGSAACLAAVIRNNIHYDSLKILEGAYGVSLRELALFAEATYRADDGMSPVEKAISVILFKLEGQTILRHPNWHMGDRLLLGHVDVGRGTCEVGGRSFELRTRDFPTLDARDPYALSDDERRVMDNLLEEFGCDPERGHIINGHTPVHASAGERPVRAGGRLVVIDGGFCQAYHKTTGIAGYTLIADPRGMRIKAHRPFASIADVLDLNADIMSDDDRFEVEPRPLTVGDTDTGVDIRSQIADLRALLEAYRAGELPERTARS